MVDYFKHNRCQKNFGLEIMIEISLLRNRKKNGIK